VSPGGRFLYPPGDKNGTPLSPKKSDRGPKGATVLAQKGLGSRERSEDRAGDSDRRTLGVHLSSTQSARVFAPDMNVLGRVIRLRMTCL
jgi:hypothetical protein